ncbi:MAG: hypothetical protein H6621_01020 [Halobacteriovoraceae bacterium]|nr:hypothetical protein [Halobacteriovoraceae bacterium]MCB9093623.1 hypothetical protein [Halobacteriovoraceae bacterium]
MKSFIVLLLAVFSLSSFSQTRVKPRSAELDAIDNLIHKINTNKGYCQNLGGVQFGAEKAIPSNCGGTFSKEQKRSKDGQLIRRVKIADTRCKNIILGLDDNGYSLSVANDTATRLYQLDVDGKTATANIQINKDALGYDNDTVVVLTSTSGKTCYSMNINF